MRNGRAIHTCTVHTPPFRSLDLRPLVVMCLSSFRTVDRLRIRDLIDVDLVNHNWLELLTVYPCELVERLRTILTNPDG